MLELDPVPTYERLLLDPGAFHNQQLALAEALLTVRACSHAM